MLLALAPALALLVFGLGLRVGARGDAVRAQLVGGAAAGDRLHARLLTAREASGVREAVSMTARVFVGGHSNPAEPAWQGVTNDDGVAELVLPAGRPSFTVRIEGAAGERLAEGTVVVPAPPRHGGDDEPAWLRPTRIEGEVELSVALPGERLSTQVPTVVWVRAEPRGEPRGGVHVAAHGEEGLGVALATATTCPSGWAPLAVVAQHHLTSLRIDAVSSRGSRGVWSGPVPVAAGAPAVRVTDGAGVADASLPSLRLPPESLQALIFATPAARRAYVVVGSESARALAATVELHDSSSGARGALSLPPFAEGLWWVLASASPGAVESASPASFGEPLLIGHAPLTLAELARAPLPDGCAVAERIATARRPRYTMSLLVDGFASKQADDAQRRRLGLTLALAGLFVGAVLEGALVMLGARESRAALARLSAELDDEAALEPPPRLAALRVVIALLLVTLGFLLFAAMAGAWG